MERGFIECVRGQAAERVAGLGGGEKDPGIPGRHDLRVQADRRPVGEDIAARAVRDGADADARRVRQLRQFSLTRADDGQHRQISIKRVRGGGKPDGEVSTVMCDTVQVGDVVTMSLPYGDIVLGDRDARSCSPAPAPASPLMAGMTVHLAAAGSGLEMMLLHADEHEGTVALRRQVVSDVLALPNASFHVWYANGTGSHEPIDGCTPG